MGTPYKNIIRLFLHRVELDRKYFFYNDLDEVQAMEVAESRAYVFMEEACGRICMECQPVVDFSLKYSDDGCVDENESFSFDMKPQEQYLLVSLMFEAYMSRDISYLKLMDVNFTGTEMRVFDPSNARKTFYTLYDSVCEANKSFIDTYKNSDRETGMYNTLDFSKYDFKTSIYESLMEGS